MTVLSNNKEASFNYFLSDHMEAGIMLVGTEIKSLRQNGASLKEAHVAVQGNEVFLYNCHITCYSHGNINNHDERRVKKLLLHKHQIKYLAETVKLQKLTIIPLKIYLSKGRAKIEIALGKGKKLHDKRATLKEKTIDRQLKRGDHENI